MIVNTIELLSSGASLLPGDRHRLPLLPPGPHPDSPYRNTHITNVSDAALFRIAIVNVASAFSVNRKMRQSLSKAGCFEGIYTFTPAVTSSGLLSNVCFKSLLISIPDLSDFLLKDL